MNSTLLNVELVFKETYEELETLFECSYVSYFYQHQDYKLSLVTNTDWMNIYVNDNLMNNCSLIRVGLEKIESSKSRNVILRWNDISPNSKLERKTNGIRSEFNICNGISFGRNILGISDYFGMASDSKNYDFPRTIILNSQKIRCLMNKLFEAASTKLFYDFVSLGRTPPLIK